MQLPDILGYSPKTFMKWHGGIYTITNTANGFVYVGQASCFLPRYECHIGTMRRNCGQNKPMQADWNKYGEDCFVFDMPIWFRVSMLQNGGIIRNRTMTELELSLYNQYEGRRYNVQRPRDVVVERD